MYIYSDENIYIYIYTCCSLLYKYIDSIYIAYSPGLGPLAC